MFNPIYNLSVKPACANQVAVHRDMQDGSIAVTVNQGIQINGKTRNL
jgi:hypothetical protein